MKLKLSKTQTFLATLSITATIALLMIGCATEKEQVVTPALTNSAGIVTPATTNTVVEINQAVFDGECLVIGTVVSVGIPIFVQYDPSIQPDLKICYTGLNSIVNGVNTDTVSQLLKLLGPSATNAATAGAISNLTVVLSKWEQSELNKYGTNAYLAIIKGEAQAAVTAWPAADQ